MHVKVAVDKRVCAPCAAKLIANRLPPIAFTACKFAVLSANSNACCSWRAAASLCAWRWASNRNARCCRSSSAHARLASANWAAVAASHLVATSARSSGGSAARWSTIADAALYSTPLYSSLYSVKRAVERYTALTHPTTPLQSYTAYTALYSVVYYTAIQLIQYTALYNHPLALCRSFGSRCERTVTSIYSVMDTSNGP